MGITHHDELAVRDRWAGKLDDNGHRTLMMSMEGSKRWVQRDVPSLDED